MSERPEVLPQSTTTKINGNTNLHQNKQDAPKVTYLPQGTEQNDANGKNMSMSDHSNSSRDTSNHRSSKKRSRSPKRKSREHDRKRKYSRDRRSRSRDYDRRSRDRKHKRSYSRDSYESDRDRKRDKKDKKKKKDKKHKKEKKRSRKSLEREEERKKQARLAKARMMAALHQNESANIGGGLEDDLDMPEIDYVPQPTIQPVQQPIVNEQIQEQPPLPKVQSPTNQPPTNNVTIQNNINPPEINQTLIENKLNAPYKIDQDIKIINKEEIIPLNNQPQKKGKFQEIVEDPSKIAKAKEDEVEEGQIVDDTNQAEVINIGLKTNTNTKSDQPQTFNKPRPFAFVKDEQDKPFLKSFGNRFTTAPIQQTKPQVEEEEDPFDAYMKQIDEEAVAQQNVMHPNMMYDEYTGEEDQQFDSNQSVPNKNVITFDDFMELEDQPDEQQDNQEDLEKEEFHQKFLQELKKKEMLEKLKEESNQVIFNDEDDKYIMDFEKVEEEAESFLEKEKRKTEKKDLKAVDHSNEEYEKINKNLYIETKEIARMTDKEVQEFRKTYGDIKVRGLKCPKPIMNWYQCGLPDGVLDVIESKQFTKPFPIQCQSIPAIMSGRDVIGIAETGSGKTLAYVLPMIRHIRDQRPLEEGEGMIGLLMAPTRELAKQIYKESKAFAKACNLRVACVYGGANVQGQLSELKRGAEIVVCTPGRMIDVLTTSNGKITNLKRCSYIVLDEADRMLDMGFEPQISRIIQNSRPDKQCVMFSATFPRQIENLAKKILNSPIEIVVGNRGQTCTNVEQFVEVLDPEEKFWRLMELLGEYYEKGSILIFVDKQIEADELFKELYKVGYKALVLHGGQDQTDREFTIEDFKKGVRNIMVATSVCARGLDIKHIKLVINYVCPNHLEDYVHRVGRTGRAGQKGTAYTFITHDECQYASEIIKALENSNNAIPESLVQLEKEYQSKVEEGEIEKKKANIGFTGKGYEFDEKEKNKIKEFRKELSKVYGFGLEDEENDEANEGMILNTQQREEERKRQEEIQLIQLVERDPHARKAAMEAGNQASRNAIKQGLSPEEATRVAKEAMLLVLQQYKPATVTLETGLQSVLQIRDQYIDKENEKNNIFTAEFEINDYPQQARNKVQNKEFLQSIYEMTGCKVVSKGQYFEFGRKPPTGQRRLYLYIEGASKQEVANAYKEVKRFIEEASINNHQGQGANLQFSGQFAKY